MWKPREDSFAGEMKPDDKTMDMLCHLLGIFLGILGPLIVWLTKRDSSPYVNVHGREAINFHLSFIIYIVALGLISAVLAMIPFIGCVVILFPVLIGLMLLIAVVLLIVGAVKANQGKVFRYPVTIRMIR
ncbi:MAG TPA: DUF4870 domain-containing protein [Phycisphaerae bacterium]|nr:DUF4870 domain-containing protein [Phycisphaerae bacterium]